MASFSTRKSFIPGRKKSEFFELQMTSKKKKEKEDEFLTWIWNVDLPVLFYWRQVVLIPVDTSSAIFRFSVNFNIFDFFCFGI